MFEVLIIRMEVQIWAMGVVLAYFTHICFKLGLHGGYVRI